MLFSLAGNRDQIFEVKGRHLHVPVIFILCLNNNSSHEREDPRDVQVRTT